MEQCRTWLVNFIAGKIQLASFDHSEKNAELGSNNYGAIDVK